MFFMNEAASFPKAFGIRIATKAKHLKSGCLLFDMILKKCEHPTLFYGWDYEYLEHPMSGDVKVTHQNRISATISNRVNSDDSLRNSFSCLLTSKISFDRFSIT